MEVQLTILTSVLFLSLLYLHFSLHTRHLSFSLDREQIVHTPQHHQLKKQNQEGTGRGQYLYRIRSVFQRFLADRDENEDPLQTV